jgi:4'-phosphopantetheinyl transferase
LCRTGRPVRISPERRAPPLFDVWLFDLDQNATSVIETLDERASRFIFPIDSRRYAAAHGYLRIVLAQYLQCEPSSITFEYGQWGKPALPTAITKRLSFNLAHSGGFALLAVGVTESIGVDLEFMRPFENWREVAGSTFAPGEATKRFSPRIAICASLVSAFS